MRVAVVRGANLNPWELRNLPEGPDLLAIGSRHGSFDAQALPIPARRLLSPADATSRLPGLAQGLIVRFTGPLDHLFGLRAALRGFDIAHVAELGNPYSAQALHARDSGAVRRVVATVWENIALPEPANPLVARRVETVARGVDHCIAISERARLHLRLAGVPDERIEVLPMGVDLQRFHPTRAQPPDAAHLRVLCVGRLVSEKGVEDLVVALRLLAERGVAAELTLAGTGPLAPRLTRMAHGLGVADRLRLLGGVPYEELPALHRVADVVVLASGPRATWREQFGFAVVEAMASGLAVLAGDSGSLAEVVGDPDQLVVPHDPPALAEALALLAARPELRAERGAANRRRAEERFDSRAVGRRLAELYERVLAAPVRPPERRRPRVG